MGERGPRDGLFWRLRLVGRKFSISISRSAQGFQMRRAFVFLAVCGWALGTFHSAWADDPPPVPREFRGVWVASVQNIDWPSKRGLSTKQQQRELVRIME